MKFVLHTIKNGCRLGAMTEVMTGKCAETPMCILYTRAGSVPYLSRDVLDKIEGLPALVNTPLGLIAEHAEVVSQVPDGYKAFCGLNDFGTYLTVQDPGVATPSGYNEGKQVSVWGKGGKLKVDAAGYVRMLESLRVDWAQCLCDSDTDRDSSVKRARRSVDRTLDSLDQLMTAQHNSQTLKQTRLVGVIQGGHLVEERLRSARETVKRPVSGFTVQGLHHNGPDTESFSYPEISSLLSQTLAVLPEDKPRFLSGVLNPENLLHCVRAGFDIFDTSYSYVVSERGCALVFISQSKKQQDPPETEADNTDKKSSQSDNLSWEICLKEQRFADDFGPLMPGCGCYACSHHTRAYLHHLLNVSELLAGVLLMIHNTHRYLRYFEDVRAAVASDAVEDLQQLIRSQKPS